MLGSNYQSGCPFWFCSLPCPSFRVSAFTGGNAAFSCRRVGVMALRLALGTLILTAFFKPPGNAGFAKRACSIVLWSVAPNYLFYHLLIW